MGGNGYPTPRASAIGMELRTAREAAGLSVRELAPRIGVHHSTLSRWETGSRMPRPEDVAAVLVGLGVVDARRDELVELARAGDRPQWLSLGSTQQQWQLGTLLEFEANATRIVCVEPLLIPGLLQTREYARAIMEGGGIPAEEIELRVAVRLGRRDILTHPQRPRLQALVGEAALSTGIGGPEVMRDQLAKLLDMASTVDLRVVPLAAGWQPGLMGPFTIVERAEGDPIVHIETLDLGLFLHETKDTVSYVTAADMVLRSAMDPEASSRLIADSMPTLET